ncbi:MAG: hypothetical protein IKV03_01450 [Alphaproteobacteria bacterium]|nr:hypothetical protein [Alphaproteobacteria bacterium]
MKTVKTYMVRKPSDIEEVRNLTQQYAHQAEKVVIAETVHLSPAWYQAVCQQPLDNYIFLSGKGGYNEDNQRQVVAGQPTLYADPSGSSYCRYLGIEIKEGEQHV